MAIKIALLCALAACAFAEPPVDRSYLPPGRGNGNFGAPSSQYGAPGGDFGGAAPAPVYGAPGLGNGNGNGGYMSNALSTRYGAPSRNGGGPSSRYGAPGRGNGGSRRNGGAPSAQYGVPGRNGGGARNGYSSGGRSNGLGSLSSRYGAPSRNGNGFGSPSQQYGAPSQQYGAPSQQYGAPSQQYGAPSQQYGAPSNGNGFSNSFAAPSQQYGAPNGNGFGAPSQQYGVPGRNGNSYSSAGRNGFGAAPSSQYGAPNGNNGGSSYAAAGAGSPSLRGPAPVYGAPGYSSRRTTTEDPLAEPANYEFQYAVEDEESGANFGHQEDRQEESAQGEYRVTLPDGRTQIVEYTADDEGYNPVIRYEEADGPYPASQGGRGGNNGFGGQGPY